MIMTYETKAQFENSQKKRIHIQPSKFSTIQPPDVNGMEWKDMAVKQLVWGVKRNWHEQSVLQSVTVRRLTGNN